MYLTASLMTWKVQKIIQISEENDVLFLQASAHGDFQRENCIQWGLLPYTITPSLVLTRYWKDLRLLWRK